MEDLQKENELLREKVGLLEKELNETKEHLKKYTAPAYKKQYYENHKEEIKLKKQNYQPTPEQKKEWARRAYLKKKEKNDKKENVTL